MKSFLVNLFARLFGYVYLKHSDFIVPKESLSDENYQNCKSWIDYDLMSGHKSGFSPEHEFEWCVMDGIFNKAHNNFDKHFVQYLIANK